MEEKRGAQGGAKGRSAARLATPPPRRAIHGAPLHLGDNLRVRVGEQANAVAEDAVVELFVVDQLAVVCDGDLRGGRLEQERLRAEYGAVACTPSGGGVGGGGVRGGG